MGQLRRFFVLPSEIEGNKAEIRSEYNHIAKVLRARVGDRYVICCGDGMDRVCQVTGVTADTAYLDVVDSYVNSAESKQAITLFQGVIKGDGMDYVVQKAVELGTIEIVPFTSQYTVAECKGGKAERLTKIAKEAVKQCGRARLVTVSEQISFKQLTERLSGFEQALFCDERGGKPLLSVYKMDAKNAAIVVGSEGGFSENEQEMLQKVAQSVSLGKRILKAETASLYVLSAIDAKNYE